MKSADPEEEGAEINLLLELLQYYDPVTEVLIVYSLSWQSFEFIVSVWE